jgi:hypothetical protein
MSKGMVIAIIKKNLENNDRITSILISEFSSTITGNKTVDKLQEKAIKYTFIYGIFRKKNGYIKEKKDIITIKNLAFLLKPKKRYVKLINAIKSRKHMNL